MLHSRDISYLSDLSYFRFAVEYSCFLKYVFPDCLMVKLISIIFSFYIKQGNLWAYCKTITKFKIHIGLLLPSAHMHRTSRHDVGLVDITSHKYDFPQCRTLVENNVILFWVNSVVQPGLTYIFKIEIRSVIREFWVVISCLIYWHTIVFSL